MSWQEAAVLSLAVVIGLWGVGAYNRLIRLRSEIGRAFVGVATQLLLRDGLLRQWADAMQAFLEPSLAAGSEFIAECDRLRATLARAQPRPHVAAEIGELAAAEQALTAARAQLAAELPVHAHHISAVGAGLGASVMQVNEELGACDAALAFASGQFNARVHHYNQALLQFPTVMLTGVFGFRAAAAI